MTLGRQCVGERHADFTPSRIAVVLHTVSCRSGLAPVASRIGGLPHKQIGERWVAARWASGSSSRRSFQSG